jgi:hypothetical protein
VLPSAFNSLLLPTDPEAINYPDKTLESVSATGGLATEKCDELRWKDAQYCANYFPGRVRRIGQNGLVGKLMELEQVARSNLDQKLKKGVLTSLTKESETSSKPDERTIYGRY